MRPHRPDVDDRAAAAVCDHLPGHRLSQEKRAAIDVEVGIVVAGAVLHKGLRGKDARAVDQETRLWKLGLNLLAQLCNLRRASEVSLDENGARHLRYGRPPFLRIAANHDCLPAGCAYSFGQRQSDSAGAAADEDGLVLKVHNTSIMIY